MRVLVVTNMYPTASEPGFAPFVREQVEALSLRQEVDRIDVMVIDGRESKLNYLRGYFEYWGRLRRTRYDIVHAHYGLSGLIAIAQRSIPVVITFHGSDVDGPRLSNRLQRLGSRFASRRARANIAVSKPIQALLGGAAELIPCGIDMDQFDVRDQSRAREHLSLRPGGLVLLFPSSPKRPEKQYEAYQQVLAKVRKSNPDVQSVVLEGFTREEVPIVLAAVDVMVLTSRIEGTPVAVMEAMASGLPVVATDVGDVRSMLSLTSRAFVAPFNAERFAAEAVKLGTDSVRRTRLSGAERFDMRTIVDQVLDVYARCVTGRN